jgi:hypothetical protein
MKGLKNQWPSLHLVAPASLSTIMSESTDENHNPVPCNALCLGPRKKLLVSLFCFFFCINEAHLTIRACSDTICWQEVMTADS